MSNGWKWFLLSFFGGAIVFWIPDIIIPAFKRDEQGYAVTAACPLASLLFYAVVLRLRRPMASGPSTAIFSIFGMWVLALPFAMLAQQMRAEQGDSSLGPMFGTFSFQVSYRREL